MIGVWLLVAVVVAAIVFGVVGAARRGSEAARRRRAEARVRDALAPAGPDGSAAAAEAREARMGTVAAGVPALPAADAGALVLACRRAFSRDVVPVLVAAMGHPSAAVRTDAAQALADLGSPGLRAVWRAVDGGTAGPAHRAFLCNHPDWLFDRLIDAYQAQGAAAVRRHADLWRDAGLRRRLEALRADDEINRLRGEAILAALDAPAGPVPPGNGDRVA